MGSFSSLRSFTMVYWLPRSDGDDTKIAWCSVIRVVIFEMGRVLHNKNKISDDGHVGRSDAPQALLHHPQECLTELFVQEVLWTKKYCFPKGKCEHVLMSWIVVTDLPMFFPSKGSKLIPSHLFLLLFILAGDTTTCHPPSTQVCHVCCANPLG
jgi:hypothetical protein